MEGGWIKANLSKCMMAQVTLCLHRSSTIHFLFILALYQSHWQFLPDVCGYPMGVWVGWWGDLETSSHLSHLPFLFSLWEQHFRHSDSRREKCFLSALNSSVSTYILWKSACFMSDVLLLSFSAFIMLEGHSPPPPLFPLPHLGWRR